MPDEDGAEQAFKAWVASYATARQRLETQLAVDWTSAEWSSVAVRCPVCAAVVGRAGVGQHTAWHLRCMQ